jgi:hypothetical protein
MHRISRTRAGAAIAALAVAGLVSTGSDVALAANRAPSTGGATTLNVAITDHGMYLDGTTTFAAGRVKVLLEDARSSHDAVLAVVRLVPGYTWKEYRDDLKVAFSNLFAPNGNKKKGLRRLNHAIHHAVGYGGFDAHAGEKRSATLLLNVPSASYFAYDDSGNLPKRPHRLTVTAASGPQTLPTADATVIAKTNRRFGGDTVLPARGTIEFVNHSTESPHFLILQHVKEGTTRKQVRQGLQSNSQPSWVLPEEAATDVVSLHQKMVLHVHVPAGEYVEMCFFPDPQEGTPHALMGMIRIVHLR